MPRHRLNHVKPHGPGNDGVLRTMRIFCSRSTAAVHNPCFMPCLSQMVRSQHSNVGPAYHLDEHQREQHEFATHHIQRSVSNGFAVRFACILVADCRHCISNALHLTTSHATVLGLLHGSSLHPTRITYDQPKHAAITFRDKMHDATHASTTVWHDPPTDSYTENLTLLHSWVHSPAQHNLLVTSGFRMEPLIAELYVGLAGGHFREHPRETLHGSSLLPATRTSATYHLCRLSNSFVHKFSRSYLSLAATMANVHWSNASVSAPLCNATQRGPGASDDAHVLRWHLPTASRLGGLRQASGSAGRCRHRCLAFV